MAPRTGTAEKHPHPQKHDEPSRKKTRSGERNAGQQQGDRKQGREKEDLEGDLLEEDHEE